MFETYWMLLFPHYILFVVFVGLAFMAAVCRSISRSAFVSGVLVGIVWLVLVFIEVVLPHSKNF